MSAQTDGSGLKTCTRCHVPQPADLEHFPLNRKKTSLNSWCRECYRAVQRDRYHNILKNDPEAMAVHRGQSSNGMRKVYDERHAAGLTVRGTQRKSNSGPKRKPRVPPPPPATDRLASVVARVTGGGPIEVAPPPGPPVIEARVPVAPPGPVKPLRVRPLAGEPSKAKAAVVPRKPAARRAPDPPPPPRPAIAHIPREERRDLPKCHLCLRILRNGAACDRCRDRAATPAGNDLHVTSASYTSTTERKRPR